MFAFRKIIWGRPLISYVANPIAHSGSVAPALSLQQANTQAIPCCRVQTTLPPPRPLLFYFFVQDGEKVFRLDLMVALSVLKLLFFLKN